MKTIPLLLMLLAATLSSACVPLASLYPLWDEPHLASLPTLAGSWTEENGSDILKFAAAKSGSYALTYCSNDGVSHYEVHAVALNGRFFLDFYPDSEALEKRLQGEAYLPLIPTHFFARMVTNGDSLKLAFLDDEAVEKRVKDGELDVPLQNWDDGILLTADTKTIQELVAKIGDSDGLWGKTASFTRTPLRH